MNYEPWCGSRRPGHIHWCAYCGTEIVCQQLPHAPTCPNCLEIEWRDEE